jgi:hypothetical protein
VRDGGPGERVETDRDRFGERVVAESEDERADESLHRNRGCSEDEEAADREADAASHTGSRGEARELVGERDVAVRPPETATVERRKLTVLNRKTTAPGGPGAGSGTSAGATVVNWTEPPRRTPNAANAAGTVRFTVHGSARVGVKLWDFLSVFGCELDSFFS